MKVTDTEGGLRLAATAILGAVLGMALGLLSSAFATTWSLTSWAVLMVLVGIHLIGDRLVTEFRGMLYLLAQALQRLA